MILAAETSLDIGQQIIGLLPEGTSVSAVLLIVWIMLRNMREARSDYTAALKSQTDEFKAIIEDMRTDRREDSDKLSRSMSEVAATNRGMEIQLTRVCERLGASQPKTAG